MCYHSDLYRELQSVSIVPNISGMASGRTDADSVADSLSSGEMVSLVDFFTPRRYALTDDFSLVEKEIQELESEGVALQFSFEEIEKKLQKLPLYIHSVIGKSSSGASIDFQTTPQPPTNGSVKILLEQVRKLAKKDFEINVASDTAEESQRIKELIEEAGEARDEMPMKDDGDEPESNQIPPHPICR